MKIDWLTKLSHWLQTTAFCLAISAIQFAVRPGRSYEMPLVYSLCIGTVTWAVIDFGRHAFTSARETGWPSGVAGAVLPLFGIVAGYFFGTLAGDIWFGWSSWSTNPDARSQLPVSITITTIAGVVCTYYFYTRNKARYLETKMAEARSHASEAKLKLLETQLEPHMLFNTLANLRVLVGTDSARAQTMLDHLVAYLRATLSASRTSNHTLQTEFDRLRDYLELMAVRMGPRLRYQLELPTELAHAQIPTMLLQPLVENAIKHGLEPKVEGGDILVQATRSGTELQLDVIDTGVGMVHGKGGADGFGLQHVRERLTSAFGERALVELVPQLRPGTGIRLSLPYTQ